MYSVSGHAQMISDAVRTRAYAEALRRAVTPGSVVVDLGAGTGLFAALACRFGARRVYAIEPDDIIELARQLAARNGLCDRIQFMQEPSSRVRLPELADVVVSDLRDILPFFMRHIPTIADARRRLLRPGGVLIPQRDTLWAGPVEAPELHAPTKAASIDSLNMLDIEPLWKVATQACAKARVRPEQLLAQPAAWAAVDYRTVEDPDVSANITWKITRSGTGHGFVAWFDAELVDGVEFSNAPQAPEALYGSLFFPWTKAVHLKAGDNVCVQLQARLVRDHYVWSWDTSFAGVEPTEHRQTTFHGAMLSAQALAKSAADHVPVLSDAGRADFMILSLVDGKRSLREIAHLAAQRFPESFPRWEDALTRVGELSARYSR